MSLIKVDVTQDMKPLTDHMFIGDDSGLEEQLIVKSRQANILKYTPKDASVRFGDQVMLTTWKTKGRTLFWLVGDNNDLAGVIWFGKSTFPLDIEGLETPTETFAIRLYEGYTGHGLAVPFMKLALKAAVELKQQNDQQIDGVWLQTDLTNPAAIAVYTKFGFKEVARDDARVTMVLDREKILDIAQSA